MSDSRAPATYIFSIRHTTVSLILSPQICSPAFFVHGDTGTVRTALVVVRASSSGWQTRTPCDLTPLVRAITDANAGGRQFVAGGFDPFPTGQT
ncbi:MAG TPA: hypothetical protein VHZ74_11620 [Bryobacteraceae bacterium]|nr:hypothetical protein [Bryobacteraceae bacterium]